MNLIDITNKNIKEQFAIKNNEDYFIFCVGSGSAELSFNIDAKNINANIYGVVISKNQEGVNLKTSLVHNVPDSKSWFHLKGLFFDSAKMDFEGMIKIEQNAENSDAYLKNDNLVIGENAIVNSAPQLEIKNQNVKASHGVTIKTLEEAEFFYMQSRVLPKKEAEMLLIKGFVLDLLNKYVDPSSANENDHKLIDYVLHGLEV
mgnify:CR=1 FL=1